MAIKTDDSFGFITKPPVKTDNIAKEEFGFTSQMQFDSLLIFQVINSHYSLKDLLEGLDIEVKGPNMFCPFHMDSLTGKPSAKYYDATDSLFCFSESKSYTAYHALKLLYKEDVKAKFLDVWQTLSGDAKVKYAQEYDNTGAGKSEGFINPVWTHYRSVTEKFKMGEVNFQKHKLALYKLFTMMADRDKEMKVKGRVS